MLAYIFSYRYVFYQRKRNAVKKLLYISHPLNFIVGTSHFQSCSWADAALEIGVRLELWELCYKVM